MDTEIVRRFKSSLPMLREWIDLFVQDHSSQARAISSLGFKRLPDFFHQELLEQTKVVTVERLPFPPLSRFGIPEFAELEKAVLEQARFAGVTFQDTVFIQVNSQTSESLHFHELVHVVQWNRLGADNFLMAYGIGLMQFGYEASPLEQMAYSLQAQFDKGTLPATLETAATEIEKGTDAIWGPVASLLAAAAASDANALSSEQIG